MGEPIRHLLALGLSAGEIGQLGLDESTLRAICEHARLDGEIGSSPAPNVVEALLDTLADETRKVDLELEMLGLRKKALSNRAKLLRRIAHTFETQGQDPTAR